MLVFIGYLLLSTLRWLHINFRTLTIFCIDQISNQQQYKSFAAAPPDGSTGDTRGRTFYCKFCAACFFAAFVSCYAFVMTLVLWVNFVDLKFGALAVVGHFEVWRFRKCLAVLAPSDRGFWGAWSRRKYKRL